MSESETMSSITWHDQLEEYFASTGEKAHCLSWCHKQAEQIYSKRKTYIDLPVIALSTVTGFLSVGSTTLFQGQERESSIGLGCVSLFVAVLNVFGTYFGWAKRAQNHRTSSLEYSKLYRNLMVELGLPREERQSPNSLLKSVRTEYDRLQEISPLLPVEIISEFKKKFNTPAYADINKPEELNGLSKIKVHYNPLQSVRESKITVVTSAE